MVPQILLPSDDVDIVKWSVIACDQYITDKGYWRHATDLVGDSPSTLKLIFPEAYLGDGDETERIEGIHKRMDQYLSDGTLGREVEGFLLIERTLPNGKTRKGLVVALDLECYDLRPKSRALIRSTEGTYVEKLATRMDVRRGASLETPHILVLIDDPGKGIIEQLFEGDPEKLYDFPLMMDGGNISYYLIDSQKDIDEIASKLESHASARCFKDRYDVDCEDIFLYAMGDGNHSFAAAQKFWEDIRDDLPHEERKTHPARYALVELVNLHDDGMEIEPIHRLVHDVDPEMLFDGMRSYFEERDAEVEFLPLEGDPETAKIEAEEDVHIFPYRNGEKTGIIKVKNPPYRLESETLEEFLMHYTFSDTVAGVCFIHGAPVVTKLAAEPTSVGFYLAPIDKSTVFSSVIKYGAFPRKSISLGHADDKKFYLECRRIK